MKKTLISMMGVAVVLSSAMAQENENKEQQTQKDVVAQQTDYNELIEKQMQERREAFNEARLQKDEKALAQFLERQRNRILEWEKQQSRTR